MRLVILKMEFMKQLSSYLLAIIALASSALADDSLYSTGYTSCMNQSNGVTFDMIDCITSEIEVQDNKLNEAYKKLMKELPPLRAQQLKEAQRVWIKYRDKNCEFYNDPDGGQMARLDSNYCVLRTTAERAQELTDILSQNS